MQIFKKVHLLQALFFINIFFTTSKSEATTTTNCGKIRIQSPFFHQNSTNLSPLSHMLICKAQKLYFRTSIGLFQISSIDYDTKLLTISHNFCSSASQFISPASISAGFPHPPQRNSLVLYNCSTQKSSVSPYMIRNCTSLPSCGVAEKGLFSCFMVEDIRNLDMGFHPRQMNCTHYSRMYRNASTEENGYGFELGTRISFDLIPDHIPNPCNECKKPYGNCGAALRCLCHAKECKDKVVSAGVILNPFGCVIFSLVCFIAMLELFNIS